MYKKLRHAISVMAHLLEGTHKLLDPVSNITVNFCSGVPIEIGP